MSGFHVWKSPIQSNSSGGDYLPTPHLNSANSGLLTPYPCIAKIYLSMITATSPSSASTFELQLSLSHHLSLVMNKSGSCKGDRKECYDVYVEEQYIAWLEVNFSGVVPLGLHNSIDNFSHVSPLNPVDQSSFCPLPTASTEAGAPRTVSCI